MSGREFTREDNSSAAPVAMITESTARRFWPNASPLGKQVQVGNDKWATIIGVVEDGRHRVAGQAPPVFVYGASLQSESNNTLMTLVVRYRGDKTNLIDAIRRETRALDARLPVQWVVTLSEAVGMLIRLVLGLRSDALFESVASRRRRIDAKLARYLDRRRRPASSALRKPA